MPNAGLLRDHPLEDICHTCLSSDNLIGANFENFQKIIEEAFFFFLIN